MKNDSNLEKSGSFYAMFMERAYGVYDSQEPGMQASVMENLIVAENQRIYSVVQLVHFEKQLVQIKDYMEAAFDQYIANPKMSEEQKETLRGYKSEINWAVNSDELMDVVIKTIDATVNVSMDMA